MPSHYLNQCWNIVNWTLGSKLQWNFNRNSNIFIQENAIENIVCEMASILSRPQCVKTALHVLSANIPVDVIYCQPMNNFCIGALRCHNGSIGPNIGQLNAADQITAPPPPWPSTGLWYGICALSEWYNTAFSISISNANDFGSNAYFSWYLRCWYMYVACVPLMIHRDHYILQITRWTFFGLDVARFCHAWLSILNDVVASQIVA